MVTRFRVLGPLQAFNGDEALRLPDGKVSALLAALLLRANRVATVGELIDLLWEHDPPADARRTVQVYVVRLRRLLGKAVIETQPGGYLLPATAESLDLLRFQALVRDSAADPATERTRLQEALALWRRPMLPEVASEPLWRDEIGALEEQWAQTTERLIELDLEAGRHAEWLPELTRLVTQFPYREGFWAQLMLAQYRTGRQAEALESYARVAEVLAEELGIDPGARLRELHLAMLTGAVRPAEPVVRIAPVAAVESGWTVQCQLPLDVRPFVGRDEQVALLSALLTDDAGGVPIAVVCGLPGVGKSALAVHVAHRVRPRFPDGQWLVRLRAADGTPRGAGELLRQLLSASGIPPTAVPDGVEERAATLRARLVGRRVLVVLDDAVDADQVRPLLPGVEGSAVVVTSRGRLDGLVALHAAQTVLLDVLEPAAAGALLAALVGPDRMVTDAGVVAELCDLCGRLPLALRIAAANLASRAGATVADQVAELRAGDRLTKLAVTGDPQVTVRAAFEVSYAALNPASRALFRLLGVVPGRDVGRDEAAALLDTGPDRADALLQELAVANLVQRLTSDRYQLHDLLRLYAAEMAGADLPGPARESALDRLCAWYIQMAATAADRLYPNLGRLVRPRTDPAVFPDPEAATAWLEANIANVQAFIVNAAGSTRRVWDLAEVVFGYFWVRLRAGDWRDAGEAGLRAAATAGDVEAQAALHTSLGLVAALSGEYRSGIRQHRRALALARSAGNRILTGRACNNLGLAYWETGQLAEAVAHLSKARAAYADAGQRRAMVIPMVNLGLVQLHMGRLADADRTFRDGVRHCTIIDDRYGHVVALHGLAEVDLALSRLDSARWHIEQALAGYRGIQLHFVEPAALETLAAIHLASGAAERAEELADRGVEVARELHHQRWEARALNTLGAARRHRGDWGAAADNYAAALGLARRGSDRLEEIRAVLGLAACERHAGRAVEAATHDRDALDLARASGYQMLEIEALTGLAHDDAAAGRPRLAAEHAEQAMAVLARTGQHHLEAGLQVFLGVRGAM